MPAYLRALGCVSPFGLGVEALRRAIHDQARAPTREPPPGTGGRALSLGSAAWIDPLPRPARGLGRPVRFGRLDRLSHVALVAALDAAAAAGGLAPGAESGLCFGTAFGAHLSNEAFQVQREELGRGGASAALFAYTLPSSAAAEVSICLGLQGASVTLAHGVGAGLAALALASRFVERGRARCMLAGAADVLSPTLLAAAAGTAGLSEGAVFAIVRPEPDGALARIAGAAQGLDERERVEAEAAGRAGLASRDLAQTLTYGPDAPWPFEPQLGRCQAAGPLLGLCALLEGGAARLPARITAVDPAGGIDVICLVAP